MFTARSFQQILLGKLRRAAFLLAPLVLIASSCSTGEAASSEEAESTSPPTSESPPRDNGTEPTDDSAAESTIKESEWPGEESPIPAAEGVISVVGVEFDDSLNVRSGPGPDFEILTSLGPTESADATGRAWFNDGVWYEVTTGDVTGWAASSFFAYLGPVDDATTDIQGGQALTAGTIQELGQMVAETQVSTDVESTITQISEPTTGDMREIIYDVVELGEPSVYGFRLHVFAEERGTGDVLEIKSIERTALCGRGVSENGLCR